MANYELWLTTDTGARIALLDRSYWLAYTRAMNAVGAFSLGLPVDTDTRWIVPDRMIQIWRAPAGGNLSLFRSYFIRRWRYFTQGGVELLAIGGPDINDLLRRRIVAYAVDSSQNKKSGTADDIMKELVDENLITDASSPTYGSRDLSRLSKQPDLSAGESTAQGFAWDNLLEALQVLAEASATKGTALYFDIVESDVSNDAIALQFRTYTGQPGKDLTNLGAVFDQERGNLEEPWLEYDYTNAENYIYALGQGEKSDRTVSQVYDATLHDASVWARFEGVANAQTQDDTTTQVADAGKARLRAKRPIRRMGGTLIDLPAFAFGRDWIWGDKVTARYRGQDFDSIISSVQVFISGEGEETVKARLEYAE